MMLNVVSRLAVNPLRWSVTQTVCKGPNNVVIRSFKTNSSLWTDNERHFIRRAKERMGFKDRALGPTTGAPFMVGQGVLAGASVFGLGALCYYGLGMSQDAVGNSIADHRLLWPEYVKNRIKSTYMYFGGSILFTAAAATMAFRSPMLMNMMMRNSWVVLGGSLAAMIGSGMVVRGLPYTEGFGAKQIGWMVHSGIMGIVLAPIILIGGSLLARAAMMTAGIVGGLSTIAVSAPSEQFLNMAGPLSMGLGVIIASSIGSMFVPMGTAFGAGLYSIAMYGGLVLFSGFLLFDTQRIVKVAEALPPHSGVAYDPVNASMSIYLDTVNIFIRVAQLLALGGGHRKK